MKYGYRDPGTVTNTSPSWSWKRYSALLLALLFIFSLWIALDYRLLSGSNWISETYDNEDWRTNEGNLHTFGAWDLEAHVWKTEYIMEHFPYVHWNPYWYLGMPLFKYYQQGFYTVHLLTIALTGMDPARASLMLTVFGHLLATLLTFLLCYKVSRRIWISAFAASFLLSNTFISLRSYGWEPITVVFLFLYPLGLLLFLYEPLKPFRFWLALVLGLAYLSHPLLWFSLCMTMGLYLFLIAIRGNGSEETSTRHYLWQYIALVISSILIGAVQFLPQFTYEQATSGAHMGVTYLPYYQVPTNIISLKDFFFDMGNLKGPGPIIMIASLLLISFALIERKRQEKGLFRNRLISGMAFVLFMMVLFYYLELFSIFPMNLLRSIQYHRIIPEFIVTAAVLIAALSNTLKNQFQKALYYTLLISFVIASFIVIYNVQTHWRTTASIEGSQEMIIEPVEGRISMPYTDQSLSVRNSYTEIPQAYGYYEQGITNAYNDEIFSVSSGFHNRDLTLTYLKAANIGRLYVNMEEGERDRITMIRLNTSLPFHHEEGDRYGYFSIPLVDPSFAQAISSAGAEEVETLAPGCREMFKEVYCGSVGEEFVSTDDTEVTYLRSYNALLEAQNPASATMDVENPQRYLISVVNATADTAVVVKMTHDRDFTASIGGEPLDITPFGPDFMLLKPQRSGDYTIVLEYHISKAVSIGFIVSITSLIILITAFSIKTYSRRTYGKPKILKFKRGDMR